jgi:hypothetical protein
MAISVRSKVVTSRKLMPPRFEPWDIEHKHPRTHVVSLECGHTKEMLSEPGQTASCFVCREILLKALKIKKGTR